MDKIFVKINLLWATVLTVFNVCVWSILVHICGFYGAECG